jgi:predicted glycoside hydrolase/deacetylase ChbG (UPF0249 family)
MRYLIVNADDLGASPGITRGILEAHERGIVTSASLMVDTPWSAEAAALARATPELSVGLHVVLEPEPAGSPSRPWGAGEGGELRDELRRQLDRFTTLVGRSPTHLDSHHNRHRETGVREGFLALARDLGLPLRGHSPARYFPGFYGQWGGRSHPEHVGVESLLRLVAKEVGEGITELGCHPGYPDPRERSGYAAEREVELRTLCDPRARAGIEALGITRVSFHDLGRLAAARVSGEVQ